MIRLRNAALLAATLVPQIAHARAVQAQTGDAQGAQAEDAQAAPAEQAEPVSILRVEYAGLGALLTSPKDRGLLEALRMLDVRLAELPTELGQVERVPPDVLPLLSRFRDGRTLLEVGIVEPGPDSPLPFFVRLELDGAGASPSPTTLFEGLLTSTGVELGEADAEGRVALPMPVPAWYRDVGGKLVVGVGSEVEAESSQAVALLPAGAAEAVRARIDYAAFFEHGLPMLEQMGTDVSAMRPALDASGMSSVTIDAAWGSDATRSYMSATYGGWGDTAVAGILADEPIPSSALELVPADAEWALVTAYDLAALADVYVDLFEKLEGVSPDGEEFRAEAQPILAILEDLRTNFLPHVGRIQGAYASDTTGGGGLFSSVFFASLSNPEAFSAALDERLASLEEMGRSMARGYVRLQREDIEGGRITSLVFAGLPVPIQPSYAIAGGHLFLGLSSQAVRAAVEQASRGAAGLAANPRFAEQLGAVPADLCWLFFFDTPRFLRDGYSLAARAGTSLENAVRSPSDLEREPGAVLPPFAELADGALAMVWTAGVRGSDLVVSGRADRSKLVNATGLIGCFGDLYALMAFGAIAGKMSEGAAGDSVGESNELIASAEISTLQSALESYALDHGGAYPATLEELAIPDELGNFYWDGELPLDPWGQPYQYKAPKREGKEPRVTSFGPDGRRGGADDIDADTVFAEPESGLEAFLQSLFE